MKVSTFVVVTPRFAQPTGFEGPFPSRAIAHKYLAGSCFTEDGASGAEGGPELVEISYEDEEIPEGYYPNGKYLVVFGNSGDGFALDGPFEEHEDALVYAEDYTGVCTWWIVEISQ